MPPGDAVGQPAEPTEPAEAEDAKYLGSGRSSGQQLRFEAAQMLMRCQLFGKDLGASS